MEKEVQESQPAAEPKAARKAPAENNGLLETKKIQYPKEHERPKNGASDWW